MRGTYGAKRGPEKLGFCGFVQGVTGCGRLCDRFDLLLRENVRAKVWALLWVACVPFATGGWVTACCCDGLADRGEGGVGVEERGAGSKRTDRLLFRVWSVLDV